MTMQTLIERVEQAEGPSFALDCALFETVLPETWFGSMVESWFRSDGVYGCNTIDGYRHLNCLKPPAYTASIDAALSLLERGWEYNISTLYGLARAELPLNDTRITPKNTTRKDGALPLAICEAALKARRAVQAVGEIGDRK